MKRLVLFALMLVLAASTVACSSDGGDQTTPPDTQPTVGSQSTLPVPTGNCQSRLTGKVVNTTNNQSPPNVVIEIASGTFKGKTITDSNGLYGFFGLCAGEYTISITPPNAKASQPGPKVTLDGAKQVKFDLSFK